MLQPLIWEPKETDALHSHLGPSAVSLQIILKEREGKKGKSSVEQESSGQEEQGDECLHFADDLTREPASQEGMCVCVRL